MGDVSARSQAVTGVTGFQSPADDYLEPDLSLDELLMMKKPFIIPVRIANSQIQGIYQGDILIVSKAKEPWPGCYAIMDIRGDLALRQLLPDRDGWAMVTDEEGYYEPIRDESITRWGVARGLVRLFNASSQTIGKSLRPSRRQ